jgi:hypothetical protein
MVIAIYDSRQENNNPFASRIFEGGWTPGTQREHSFDRKDDQHTGVCSVFLSKVTRIGGQSISFGVIPKYWYKESASSPEGFVIRGNITLFFPLSWITN